MQCPKCKSKMRKMPSCSLWVAHYSCIICGNYSELPIQTVKPDIPPVPQYKGGYPKDRGSLAAKTRMAHARARKIATKVEVIRHDG